MFVNIILFLSVWISVLSRVRLCRCSPNGCFCHVKRGSAGRLRESFWTCPRNCYCSSRRWLVCHYTTINWIQLVPWVIKSFHVVSTIYIYTIMDYLYSYAWSIVECSYCHSHMGWLFTANDRHLQPASFWGLCRRSLKPRLKANDESEFVVVV